MPSTSTWRSRSASRPFVLLKTALSLDGHIDDAAPERKKFSSAADASAVAELRKEFDAILVGAETVRKDNPKLDVAGSSPPLKVTLTSTGELAADANFFTSGGGKKLVYATPEGAAELRRRKVAAEIAEIKELTVLAVLHDLSARRVKKLLVEGGTQIISAFLDADAVDVMRLAVAPEIIADSLAPKLVADGIQLPKGMKFAVRAVENLGGMTILEVSIQ